MTIAAIAKQLDMSPKVLEKESLKAFLKRELQLTESELYSLAIKYGVPNIKQFEQEVKKGRIPETKTSLEDFFMFDHLEAKKDKIQKLLKIL